MLGAAVKARVQTLANGITPKGSRPPFTRRMTPAETLEWWMAHRYDGTGMALVGRMTPLQVAELDAWLTQAMNHPSQQAGKVVAPPEPGVQNVLTRALGQERRVEGPPVGAEVV